MTDGDNEPPGVANPPKQVKAIKAAKPKPAPRPKKKKIDNDSPTQAIALIPLAYNDKSLIPQEILDGILDQIYLLAEGYTIEGTVEGTWKMSTGEKCVDHLMKVMIVLKAGERRQLESMANEWASELGQEAIMITYTNFEVVFVKPSEREG